MTSGPMRAGALPPDRQPDPQVIARVVLHEGMDITWDAHVAFMLRNGTASQEIQRHADGTRTVTIRARKPLAPADIPAGQGAASLYRDTDGAVWFKEANGYQRIVLLSPDEMSRETPSGQALEALLAATLPTVTDTAKESK